MVDEVLVQRTARRHVDRRRRPPPPARPTDLLPGAGDGARVAAQDRGIEVTNVDPQFEGVGADDAPHRTVAKAVLDVTPLQGQIAAAVSADRPGLAQSIGE